MRQIFFWNPITHGVVIGAWLKNCLLSKEHFFTIMIDSDFFIINVQKVKVCKLSTRECFSYFPLFFLREFPCVMILTAHKIAIRCKNKLYIKQSILHSDVNNNSRKFKTHPKGQTNSKWFFQTDVSSKKRMNKFNFISCRLVFVRFLEESEDNKNTFRN